MKTISFYSYKGGVGRTTLVAQIARLLAALGKKVAVMDFDFDAPGVTAAFNKDIMSIEGGLFELFKDYSEPDLNDKKSILLIERLKNYLIDIDGLVLSGTNNDGFIKILPCGQFNESYWEEIADPKWTTLLAKAQEIKYSFEHFISTTLKNALEKEMKIEYLLIDARSGITHYGDIIERVSNSQAVIFCPNDEAENALKYIFSISGTNEAFHPNLVEKKGVFGVSLQGIYNSIDQTQKELVSVDSGMPRQLDGQKQKENELERVYIISRMPPELDEQKEEAFSRLRDIIHNDHNSQNVFRLHSDLETHLDPQVRQFDEKYKDKKTTDEKAYIVQIHEDILKIFDKLCSEACPDCPTDCPEYPECHYAANNAEDDEESVRQKKRVCALWYTIYGYPFSVTRRNRLFTFLDGVGEMHNTDNERNVAFKVKTFLGFLNSFYETIISNIKDEDMAKRIMNDSLYNAGVNCGKAFGESIVELLKGTGKWGCLESNIDKWCEFDSEAGFGLMKYNKDKEQLSVGNLFIIDADITGRDKDYCAFFTGYAESVLTELANGNLDSNERAVKGQRARLTVNDKEILKMDTAVKNNTAYIGSNIAYDIEWETTQ